MIKRIENAQLRHRIYQASFKGIQRAIEKKAKEHGISVVYVDPKSASKLCLVHSAPILYDNSTRGLSGAVWEESSGRETSLPAGTSSPEPYGAMGAVLQAPRG